MRNVATTRVAIAMYACVLAALMADLVTASLRGSVQIENFEDNLSNRRLANKQADQGLNTRERSILQSQGSTGSHCHCHCSISPGYYSSVYTLIQVVAAPNVMMPVDPVLLTCLECYKSPTQYALPGNAEKQ